MKKIFKRGLASVLAVSLLASQLCIPENAKAEEKMKDKQYIVLSNNESCLEKIDAKYGIDDTNSEILENENMALVSLTDNEAEALEKNKNVAYVEEDASVEATSIKNKRYYKKRNTKANKMGKRGKDEYTWNIKTINAENKSDDKNKNKVKVAVIDSGMDSTEAFKVERHINFVEEENDINALYEDISGHGTSIAGIIAGDGDIKGINPNVELYSLKVLDKNNKSCISRVIEAIYWCIENDINIINMSFGTDMNSDILYHAIREAYDHGILMVASAGNTGDKVQYPAVYKEVMAVGSVNGDNEISEYSARGDKIDVLAPGEKVETYGGFGGYIVASGTSMAVPHVVGIASILWEKDLSCDSQMIRTIINKSARNIGKDAGNGIVDLEYALKIYDEVKEAYNSEKNIDVPENRTEAESFDTEQYIEGQWLKEAHINSVDKGYNMGDMGALSPKLDVSIIRKYIYYPDINGYKGINFTQYFSLHGIYNYVASMKYIFNVARRVKKGATVDNAIKNTPYSDQTSYTSNNKKIKASAIENELNTMIKKIAEEESSNAKKCQCILAVAFHLAGDVYAHKSMVPKSVINNTTQKGNSLKNGYVVVNGNFFNLKQFKNYSGKNGAKSKVESGDLQTMHIKDFMKDAFKEGKYYDDNINFYSSRYTKATSWAIAAMLNDMYYNDDWFSAWTLVPELYLDNGYGIKRHKLYTFVKRCGLSIDKEEEKCIKSVSKD